jgi:signal transduction histidine kinase
LTDAEGRLVLGQLPDPGAPQAIVTAAETKLPWTLHVVSADHQADLAELAGRRQLLFAGLAMMAVLVLAGVYFIARAVTRELEVARLQSDFVSAVSHEFRSPLTSMRQLTEMLAGGRVPSEERRQRYYQVLSHETVRLHRLVEALLNFGRMEAGVKEYRFERLDGSSLVHATVSEFQEEVAESGYRIELALPEGGVTLRGDEEALRRALWNLLDNAVKYSPECRTVWVEVSLEGDELLIAVRDRGLGMSASEQKDIFSKFVRGAAARSANVKGTGIGLAMVRRIIEDHGGQTRVASEPGEGSTFTIVLPAKE